MPEKISAGATQPQGEGETAARGAVGGDEAGRGRGEGAFWKRARAAALFRDGTENPPPHRRPGAGADRSPGKPDRGGDPERDWDIGRIGPMGHMELSNVIEALLFAAQKPLTIRELVAAIKG